MRPTTRVRGWMRQEALWVIVLAGEQYLHIDADREFGFGPAGLRQIRRHRRRPRVPTRHVPKRRRQLAPLRSTMQAPPARRMLPHRESAAWRVSAPTRTW